MSINVAKATKKVESSDEEEENDQSEKSDNDDEEDKRPTRRAAAKKKAPAKAKAKSKSKAATTKKVAKGKKDSDNDNEETKESKSSKSQSKKTGFAAPTTVITKILSFLEADMSYDAHCGVNKEWCAAAREVPNTIVRWYASSKKKNDPKRGEAATSWSPYWLAVAKYPKLSSFEGFTVMLEMDKVKELLDEYPQLWDNIRSLSIAQRDIDTMAPFINDVLTRLMKGNQFKSLTISPRGKEVGNIIANSWQKDLVPALLKFDRNIAFNGDTAGKCKADGCFKDGYTGW
jgi:hypothetical protein